MSGSEGEGAIFHSSAKWTRCLKTCLRSFLRAFQKNVVTGDKVVQIIAEVPSVEKEDIQLFGTEETLTIFVDTEKRKYRKEVDLPVKVGPKSAKASYQTGVA